MAKSSVASKVKVQPLDDRLLIQPDGAEEVTAGGIVLPDSAQEKPTRGKVVATGPGRLLKDGNRSPLDVRKGDLVLYGEYAGSSVKINGEEYKILRESDVLAKFE